MGNRDWGREGAGAGVGQRPVFTRALPERSGVERQERAKCLELHCSTWLYFSATFSCADAIYLKLCLDCVALMLSLLPPPSESPPALPCVLMEIYAWEPASLFVREREKRKHMLVDGFVSVAAVEGL